MNGYDGDSFFTLSQAGQVGLLVLTVILSIGLIWLIWRLGRRCRWLPSVVIGLSAYLVFSWLSPQIYYAYYLVYFDDLPVQWVIRWPPNVLNALQEFTFTSRPSLAAHGRGILGWLCIAAALAPRQWWGQWRRKRVA